MYTCKYNIGVKNMRFNERKSKNSNVVHNFRKCINYLAPLLVLCFSRFGKQKAYLGIGANSLPALERPRSGGHLCALKSLLLLCDVKFFCGY